ncbi:hypothetical protein HN903_04660 [archaeon]|jgi:hypothetical protein|nr:hypothetical protein [archaeon]MBT7129020.1 hypothetical protein [archaeon]
MSLDMDYLAGADVKRLKDVSLGDFYKNVGVVDDGEKIRALDMVAGLGDYFPADVVADRGVNEGLVYLECAYELACGSLGSGKPATAADFNRLKD